MTLLEKYLLLWLIVYFSVVLTVFSTMYRKDRGLGLNRSRFVAGSFIAVTVVIGLFYLLGFEF